MINLDISRGKDQGLGDEPFRPQLHFTPHRNWMNDPNGLVYFDGEYHLFFQYNPQGMDWGNMCWGHAVSPDLMSWRELPVAIPETDQMIFSGGVVVDWRNESGLGDGQAPPLLAFFTAYDARRSIQSQHLAYSHDRGRSFTHYAGNPIIDLDMADFRDPKVFYHAHSAAWVMVVALAREHAVQFYRSHNLRDWTLAGVFGPTGSTSGQWECPDLIRVPVEGRDGEAHWVLKVDVDTGFIAGGSGAQYFVGRFDGHAFEVDPTLGDANGDFVDFGPDFYAAVTWSDLPAAQPGPVWVGWQSNHQSGRVYPTDPWRGAQSLPRRLFLFEERGQLSLGQAPVDAVAQLRGAPSAQPARVLGEGGAMILTPTSETFEQSITLAGDQSAAASVSLFDDQGALLTLTIAFSDQRLTFTRHGSPQCDVEPFARETTTAAPRPGVVSLRLILDRSLLEIFVDGGRRVYSANLFPVGPVKTHVLGQAGQVQVSEVVEWDLRRSIDFA